MNNRLLALVGGAAGAAAAYFTLQPRHLRSHDVKIVVRREGNRCRTDTHPSIFKAHKLDVITWRIVGNEKCLGDGAVELRFVGEKGPLLESRPRGKRLIVDMVVNGEPRVYDYKIWFVGKDGTEYEMEDPKIEIAEI